MPRKVSKRSYRKRPQKARRSRRRYYRRRFYRRNAIKKPEIHISSDNIEFSHSGLGNGLFQNITLVSGSFTGAGGGMPQFDPGSNDLIKFRINDKPIEGRKIRLKYLYIKGYLYSEDNNINGKLYIFRRKKNAANTALNWTSLMEMPFNLNNPSTWTTENINDILYKYDWKNDLAGQIKKKVKMIYKSYDNNNNYIPFKVRIPLYDCVLTCDATWNTSNNQWEAALNPSTNGLYISYITNADMGEGSTHALKLKYKLYYTDY